MGETDLEDITKIKMYIMKYRKVRIETIRKRFNKLANTTIDRILLRLKKQGIIYDPYLTYPKEGQYIEFI